MFARRQIANFVISGIVALSGVCVANEVASANSTGMSREQIRAMPLLSRPNRPGHFYGNTVRRMNARRAGN